MTPIIDGKEVAKAIKQDVKGTVEILKNAYGTTPSLHAILVGDDPASESYVRNKKRACKKLGMRSEVHHLPENTETETLEELIRELNQDKEVNGILVQLPLPNHIDKYKIMDQINPYKDVDGFTPTNIARLYRNESCLEPCTPKGILELLDYYEITTEGKMVTIIGRSEIVGKPLSLMMSSKERNATVTLCHSRTKNLKDIATTADILVSAIGVPQYLTQDYVKEGAVVIDVGINRVEDPSAKKGYRLVGDVNFESVSPKSSYITPVPGGVGPMTIACLMQNTLKAYKSTLL